jgi:hypothetical protein
MIKTITVTLLFLLSAAALGQVTFGDDLFGGTGLVTEVDENEDATPFDDILKSETIAIGGRFSVSSAINLDLGSGNEEAVSSGLVNLSTRLFLDARPTSDFRAFLKLDGNYSSETGLSVSLREMFADITVFDTVFLRAGKQAINWGVGLFFSPANLINIERIDPENAGEELAGPVSLKGQLPIGTSNLTSYLLMEDLEDGTNFSAAVRYEFLFRRSEITTGLVYQVNGPWAAMATITGAIKDVTVFAEAVAQGNTDRMFVVEDGAGGYLASTSDGLFASGTVGGRFSYNTEDDRFNVNAAAQYLFNGLGYDNSRLFSEDPSALSFLLGQVALGNISPSDLLDRGHHNAALSVSSRDIGGTDVTPSFFWLSNLSDGSGLITAGLAYSGIEFVTVNLDYRIFYGPTGAEYSVTGPSNSLGLSVKISQSF